MHPKNAILNAMYPSNNNFASKHFVFENRKINGRSAKFLDGFLNTFIKPKMPLGWRTMQQEGQLNDRRDGIEASK